ncbi:hypothetical protein PFICI_07563 [Pestalotiopsis fici W106-1]|uniref:Uncharacterized protein n=1 Tax=Pestalotiopsis fici (strain W106-1 / CGMCC3.15140) TaxID=1229662 RepID=W3X1Z2_PESFW|nr:uncharacterized protein PFICI_07563 [Pestalotiopsis fici W106-1]ETS80034.1 hypothetical protein PFICI_07563 [Pestalotiopsis fici W106-1]
MAAQSSSTPQIEMEPLPLINADVSTVGFSKIIDALMIKVPTEPKGGSAKGYSIRSMTTWEGVQEVMDRAAAEYASKSGAKGKARVVGNFIGNKGGSAKRITGVIPDFGYTKPIIGTLNFLLDAFQKADKVRTDVKDGVEKLKDNFDLVQVYLELYAAKPKVAAAALELYVTILIAVEEVINYYTKHIAIKGLKALWEGDKYEDKLLTCLKKIGDDGQKLILQADTAQKQEMQNGFSSLAAKLDNQADVLKDMAQKVMNNLLPLLEQYNQKLDITNKEYQFARRQAEIAYAENIILRGHLERATTPEIWPTTTREFLLEFLDSSDIEEADIGYITKQQISHGAPGRNRTDQIMKSHEFVQWITEPTSKELLVHGNSATTPISPLSFFCALLTQNLRRVEKFVSLAFFCGCHPYEDQGGSRTLIISLLAQLLRQEIHFDFRFLTYELAELMENGNVQAYCSVFDELVQQVSQDETLFCIIDGANFYERNEEMRHESAEVLCFLLDLTKSQTKFKILLTSPSITIEIREAIHDEDYLSLPEQGKSTADYSLLRFEREWDESING